MTNLDSAPRQLRSVLVVDSDPDVLALVSVILEGRRASEEPKLRVLRARNMPEAMEILSRAWVPVDLVLSSQRLPDPDGARIADCIHSLRPQLPVMYMSAITDAEMIRIRGCAGENRDVLRAVVATLQPPAYTRSAGAC